VNEVDGLTVQHRKLLQEALEIILDTFNDPGAAVPWLVGGFLEWPLLPRPSIASISAQVATVIEHLSWLRPHNLATLMSDSELDLSMWERVCSPAGHAAAKSTKAELVDELQQFRQRIFHLEKELGKQVQTTDAITSRARREHERTSTRLLEVNHALEGKLKQQLADNQSYKEKISDYENRIKHEHWRVQEQSDRIERTEKELAEFKRMQGDMLVREKEYGRRILDLHLHEFESACRNDQRMRKLAQALSTESRPLEQVNADQGGEADLADLAKETLARLKHDFEEIFEERQRRFFEVIRTSELRLHEQQQSADDIREQTYLDTFGSFQQGSLSRSSRFRASRHNSTFPDTADMGMQTEPASAEGAGDCSGGHPPHSARGGQRASRCLHPLRPGSMSLNRTGQGISRMSAMLAAHPLAAHPLVSGSIEDVGLESPPGLPSGSRKVLSRRRMTEHLESLRDVQALICPPSAVQQVKTYVRRTSMV